jgi:hypothetical protein
MQVFDLTQLLSGGVSVQFVEAAHYAGFGNAHNIAINEATGFAYAVGSDTYGGGLHIMNITNPSNSVFAGGFSNDCYLWKDMEISNIEEGRALNSWLIGLKF